MDGTVRFKSLLRFFTGAAVMLAACGDGDEGLERALSGAFDLVVLDVMLPGCDGFTVLEHMRKRGDKTPVLVGQNFFRHGDRYLQVDGDRLGDRDPRGDPVLPRSRCGGRCRHGRPSAYRPGCVPAVRCAT